MMDSQRYPWDRWIKSCNNHDWSIEDLNLHTINNNSEISTSRYDNEACLHHYENEEDGTSIEFSDIQFTMSIINIVIVAICDEEYFH